MKDRIEISAPGKLMLFGEHAVIYDRPCIVTAVDHRLNVTITTLPTNKLTINAPEVNIKGYEISLDDLSQQTNMPKGVRFVQTAVANFQEAFGLPGGLEITTKSSFSSEFGFGSSSAATVGVIKGLSEIFNQKISNDELFQLCYKTVLDVQGVGSGFDLAAAIWGGTIYFVTGGKKIVPLKIPPPNLVVGYTGVKADTPTLVRQVAREYENEQSKVEIVFNAMEMIVDEAKTALLDGDHLRLGQLMKENQKLLKKLGVSTEKLDELIAASTSSGAYGAKLSGAGGGDCMIALANPENQGEIKNAIKKKGGAIIDVKTATQGARIE